MTKNIKSVSLELRFFVCKVSLTRVFMLPATAVSGDADVEYDNDYIADQALIAVTVIEDGSLSQ